jgi:hypothetical protein
MYRVARSSLDWALMHAEAHGDTDVLPIPFEFAALRHDWPRIAQKLTQQDVHDVVVRPHRQLMAPKARFGFRVLTQLDPIDFLLFTATVREIGATVEAARIPTSNETVFSYRFAPMPTGQIFDPTIGYGVFQRSTRAFLDDNLAITHVAITDIADFYSRIYHHRLENALQACGVNQDRVRAVMKLLSGWNGTESYGIPVGCAASRVLAEAALIDVDEALLANQSRFKRFNDDFRFFCTSYTDAYRQLAFLAEVVFKNHGLTLQGQKTAILTRDDFIRRYLTTFEERATLRLGEQFGELIDSLNLSDPYASINYDRLSIEQKAMIDQLNLAGIFREEIGSFSGPDQGLIKFVLGRLGQLGDASIAQEVLSNIEILHPLLPEIVQYLQRLGPQLSETDRVAFGAELLALLDNSIASSLEFDRGWILSLFTEDVTWGNGARFFPLLSALGDQVSRRKLVLALGRAHQRHWFQSQWRVWTNEPHWPRRALIAATSCLAADASKHWYRANRSKFDDLELAVAAWAEANPFA